MTTIAFQKDELCSGCGNLTNPKITITVNEPITAGNKIV